MSFAGPAEAIKVRGLEPGEKLLLIVLGSYANTDNTLWPSQATLAEDTGIAERTIRTHMTALEAKGLIKREHRVVAGRRTSDFITLLFLPAKSAAALPAKSAKTTGQKASKLPAKSAAKSIIEPINESTRVRALAPRDRAAPSPDERAEVAAAMRELANSMIRKTV